MMRKPVMLIGSLSFVFVTLLFLLQILSVQAGDQEQVLPISARPVRAPWGISGPFTPTWLIETVDSTGDVGQYTSLALDSSDYPHMSYFALTNYDLKYARWNGSNWISQTVDSVGDVGEYTSLALDSSDFPHISYFDFSNFALKYARWNGSSWVSQTVDNAGAVGQLTSLALDSSDYPHISYWDNGNGDLKYARWNGSSWIIETVDSIGDVGYFSSLALDSNDYPHISYYANVDRDLKYARWNGSSWIIETVDSVGDVGEHTSLALDSSDYPHISYWDSGNGALKYARWNGSSWILQSVESPIGYSGYTSLALDSNGNPHISYQYSLAGELRYARWNGSGWSFQALGDVVYGASLALDSSDQPSIGYYHAIYAQLKLARMGSVTAVIDPITGGELAVPDLGSVTFPSGAFSAPVTVTYTPVEDVPGLPHIGIFFNLDAAYTGNGQPAPLAPGQTFTMLVRYEQSAVPGGMSEAMLRAEGWGKRAFRAPEIPGWEPALSSVVDTEANVITAVADSLTVWAIFGDYSVYLPTVTAPHLIMQEQTKERGFNNLRN